MPTSDFVFVIPIWLQREINFYVQRQIALGHMMNACELVKVVAGLESAWRQAVAKDHQRDGYRLQTSAIGKTKHKLRPEQLQSRAVRQKLLRFTLIPSDADKYVYVIYRQIDAGRLW